LEIDEDRLTALRHVEHELVVFLGVRDPVRDRVADLNLRRRVGDPFGSAVGCRQPIRLGGLLTAAGPRRGVGVAVHQHVVAVRDPQVAAGPLQRDPARMAIGRIQGPRAHQAAVQRIHEHTRLEAAGVRDPQQVPVAGQPAGLGIVLVQAEGTGRRPLAALPIGGIGIEVHPVRRVVDDPQVPSVRGDALRLAQVVGPPRAPRGPAGVIGEHLLAGVHDPQRVSGRVGRHAPRRGVAARQRPHARCHELGIVQERGPAAPVDDVEPRGLDRLNVQCERSNIRPAVVVGDRHPHLVSPRRRVPVAAVNRAARQAADATIHDGHQARGSGRTVAPVDRGRKRFKRPRRRIRKTRIGKRADLQGHVQSRVPHNSRRHRQRRRRIGDPGRNVQRRRRQCEPVVSHRQPDRVLTIVRVDVGNPKR